MECAAPLALKCSACGAEVPPRAKFCVECAQPVGKSAPAATAPPAAADYTPPHLAERILTSRGAVEGERKQVTVLFADLKGSMELLADRDPEEARRILDPVLERMMEAVHRYEGTVNQVMGDGIMALFGAPLAHEDHAVRACYAALRIQEAVKQYAEEVRRQEGIVIQARVGLNSGEVVVRAIGSDLRMDYTAVGQTTHLAARMEQLALPGSILVAPDTLGLVEGYVQVKALGLMQVKGLDAPVEVYELLGAGPARSRLQAAAGRGFTRFVGREAELETLRQTLDRAGSGHGQVVALVGEPGVGKSRLTWEFTHSHRAQGWLVLESGSVSYGKATSYLPIIDLLKSYCGIESRDDPRRLREKLTGKLLTLDPALQPTLPAFLALLDAPIEDGQWEELDPPQRRQRTLDACKRLLLRECQVQPLLLVFEDLHWVDSETQAVLDSLVDAAPAARLLLLVNYRPEYEHTWHRKTYYRELRLDPLPPESAEALLQALVGDDSALQPLKALLIARTEGNPFFLEESVRTLVEIGALEGDRGVYRLAKPVEATQVPATVQAVLAARVDRLAPEDKRLLQAAAVIGEDVPYALLLAIAEQAETDLRAGIGRLQTAEFLYEASLYPEPEYTFKHALTHEVAYGSLLQERRHALHARIVAAIETLYADRLAEQVERLAHYAVRGELWEQAIAYLRQAGAKAFARYADQEAVGYFEQALLTVERLPDSVERRELAVDLHLSLSAALYTLGELARIRDHQDRAETIARTLPNQRPLGRVLSHLSSSYWAAGDPERGQEAGRQALAVAETLGDVTGQYLTRLMLGYVTYALGDYPRAVDLITQAISRLEAVALRAAPVEIELQAEVQSVLCRNILGRSLAELGQLSEGLAVAQEAERIAIASGRPIALANGQRALGEVHLHKGELDEAISALAQAVALSRDRQMPRLLPNSTASLGYAYALAGRIRESLPLLEEGVERGAAMQIHFAQSLRCALLGEGYLLAGRPADARDRAAEALDLSRRHRERGHEAWALRLHGEIAAQAEPPDVEQAAGHYRQALVLAGELGMRPLAAHCHLGLGTLYQKVGRDEQARGELMTAIEPYRAMEMTFWLEKAEAALVEVAP
jgi:class 3 adenylate cyclase/tetratricopeptide (TPR) repeat protein